MNIIAGAAVIYLILMQIVPLNYRSLVPSTEGADHYYVAAHNSHLAEETKDALAEVPKELTEPAAFVLAQYPYLNRDSEKLLPPLLNKIKNPWRGINDEEKRRLATIVDFVEAKSRKNAEAK